MKWSLDSMRSWTTIALVCAGGIANANEIHLTGGGPGLVDGLAVMQDLEPISDRPSEPASRLSAYTVGTQARSSTPEVDPDPFASSRAILPLLVDDLNPNQASYVRPMTGRSVGARPSLPLARPESR